MASPAALALITTTFPAGKERNRAFAIYAAMAGVGAAVGLILGGWLTGLDPILGLEGWRYTFLIVVPIGLAAAFFAPRFFDESERHSGWLDVPGAITGTGALLAIVFGLSRAGQQEYGWDATSTVVSLVLGVALLAIFLLVESRVEHPLMPFRIFRSKNRAAAFAVMMIVPAAMFAMFFFLSPVHPARRGLLPAQHGHRVPAVLDRDDHLGDDRLQADRLSRPALPVGRRHAALGRGALRLLPDHRPGRPASILGSLPASMGGQGVALGGDVSYWTQVLPFVVLMAFGMGLNFVPAHPRRGAPPARAGHRHRVRRAQHAQQVGGALGLATLSTVSPHFAQTRADEFAPAIAAAARSSTRAALGQRRLARIVHRGRHDGVPRGLAA